METYVKIKDLGPLKKLNFSGEKKKEKKKKTKNYLQEGVLKEFKNAHKYTDIKFITENEKRGGKWKENECYKEKINEFNLFVGEEMIKSNMENNLIRIKKNINHFNDLLSKIIKNEKEKETEKGSKNEKMGNLTTIDAIDGEEKEFFDFSIRGQEKNTEEGTEENRTYKFDENEMTKTCHEEYIKYLYVKNKKTDEELDEDIRLLESKKNLFGLLYKVHLDNSSTYETELDKFLDVLKKKGDDVLKFIGDPYSYSVKSKANENNFYFMVKNFVKLNNSKQVSPNNTPLFTLITLQAQFEESNNIKQMCSNGKECHCKTDFDFICKYFDLEGIENTQKICLYCYIIMVNTFYYTNRMQCLESSKINDFGFICDDYSGIKGEYTLYQDKTPFYGLTSYFIRHHRSYYLLCFNGDFKFLKFKDIIFFVDRAVLKHL